MVREDTWYDLDFLKFKLGTTYVSNFVGRHLKILLIPCLYIYSHLFPMRATLYWMPTIRQGFDISHLFPTTVLRVNIEWLQGMVSTLDYSLYVWNYHKRHVQYYYYTIIQLKKLRFIMIKQLVQSHIANKLENWDLNPNSKDLKYQVLPIAPCGTMKRASLLLAEIDTS